MEQKTGIDPFSFLDSVIVIAVQAFLIQQPRCDLLHLIYRERSVHVHCRLVRLMAQKVLNPLGTEAFGLQKSGDGVAKEMRIEMGEAGIGIGHPSFDAKRRHNVVDQARCHHPVAVTQKDRAGFPTADEHEQVTEVFVVNDRDDPSFITFTLLDRHPFALDIEVADIELEEFAAPNAQPPQRFDETSIPKIGRRQEQLPHVSRSEVISRSGELMFRCRHRHPSCDIAHPFSGMQKIAPALSQEGNL
jgi:hypothetical protein